MESNGVYVHETFSNHSKPILVLSREKKTKILYTHTLSYSVPSFERFLMTPLDARSTLVNFSPTKNQASNDCIPIGVLTRKKSSGSDDRLSIDYPLLDF